MRWSLIPHMLRGTVGQKLGLVCRTLCLVISAAALSTAPAWADDRSGAGPMDSVLKALDLKTDTGNPPDFVRQSRPKTEEDFLPVGTPHPTRSIKVKTPAQLKAAEAELDAARIRHDKIAGRKPPQDPKAPPPKKLQQP